MILMARNLHKVYNNGFVKLHVLRGIDIDIRKGEWLGIIGPSGAGKSTLLHLLGGLDIPSEGEVILDGINIYSLPDHKRAYLRNMRIGFVFQFYHLLPELTALENIYLPGLIGGNRLKNGNLRSKAFNILQNMGLEGRSPHRPNELSGGEGQRVAIARALINNPDILFCDEPTGNLDSQTGSQICELLWRLSREARRTVVFVTHDERLVRRADRVLRMKDGLII